MLHNPRLDSDVSSVLALVADGLSDYEVARRTGIPRSTVCRWRRGGAPRSAPVDGCARCGGAVHDFSELPTSAYAYLLGQYLGDGTIFRVGGSFSLRIHSDSDYPGVIAECCAALVAIRAREPHLRRHPTKRMVTVTAGWKSWPCLFPQHGAGRKHNRKIELERWQAEIVETCPGQFARGLIHSDGWRGVNRVHVKGRDYAYPRYQFSNRSADIRDLFTGTCDLLGVAWRRWGKFHISVARREAVELLDRFVGPKY